MWLQQRKRKQPTTSFTIKSAIVEMTELPLQQKQWKSNLLANHLMSQLYSGEHPKNLPKESEKHSTEKGEG